MHWRIIANLGFKFRSHFTAHCGQHGGRAARRAACGRCAACGRTISRHASQCYVSCLVITPTECSITVTEKFAILFVVTVITVFINRISFILQPCGSGSVLAPLVFGEGSVGHGPPKNFVGHIVKYAVLGIKPRYNQ